MTDAELLALNQKGFIPGPRESEEHFLNRVAAAQRSATHLPRAQTEWVREQLAELFDFTPQSLNVVYSNKNLTPWQGAVCWIEDGVCMLQLREGFRKGSYLFGLYSREELLAHEAVHAARAMFDEPKNEEFFAYATSAKRWRRVLGPLVRRHWELWVWMAPLVAGVLWSWGFVVAAMLLGYATLRLARQHALRARAARALMEKLQDAGQVRAALFRMTDAEIRQLARGEALVGDASLRWRLLRAAYLPTEFSIISSQTPTTSTNRDTSTPKSDQSCGP